MGYFSSLGERARVFVWAPGVIAIAVALTLLPLREPRAGQALSLGIPGNAPLTGLDGSRATGIIAETTVIALQAMGRRVTPRRLPFKRMYSSVHAGRIDVAVSVLRTEERAKKAYYSAPIVTEYTLVMVPRGRAFPLQRLSDLEGKRIGAQLGFTYPGFERTNIKLIREKSYEVNIEKVANGKLDGALVGSITGPYLANQLGISDRVEFLPVAVGRAPLGAALSRAAFTHDDLAAFDTAVRDFQASAAWREVLAANGVEDLIREWPLVTE